MALDIKIKVNSQQISARQARIVNGRPVDANSGKAPWLVGLLNCGDRLGEPDNCGVCGATLIANGVLLSAAHCFDPQKYKDVNIYFNEYTYRLGRELYDTKVIDAWVTSFIGKTQGWLNHEDYNSNGKVNNDIALCKYLTFGEGGAGTVVLGREPIKKSLKFFMI